MERRYIILLVASAVLSAVIAFTVTYAVLVTFGAEYVAKQYASLTLAISNARDNAIQGVFDAGNRSLQSIWTAKAVVEKAMSESIKAQESQLPIVQQSFEVWLVVKPSNLCWEGESNEENIEVTLAVNSKVVFDKTYTLPTACNSYEFKVATVNYTGTFGVKEIKVGVEGSGRVTLFPTVCLVNPDSPFTKLVVTVNLATYTVTAKTGT